MTDEEVVERFREAYAAAHEAGTKELARTERLYAMLKKGQTTQANFRAHCVNAAMDAVSAMTWELRRLIDLEKQLVEWEAANAEPGSAG